MSVVIAVTASFSPSVTERAVRAIRRVSNRRRELPSRQFFFIYLVAGI